MATAAKKAPVKKQAAKKSKRTDAKAEKPMTLTPREIKRVDRLRNREAKQLNRARFAEMKADETALRLRDYVGRKWDKFSEVQQASISRDSYIDKVLTEYPPLVKPVAVKKAA